MDGMLSQEEINALLGNVDADSTSEEAAPDTVQTSSDISDTEKLTPEESDALGEISNISMGTAATTLSILVNNRVDITTPTVSYTTLEELSAQSEAPVVFIYISYKTGLQGKNLLILKERDVKVITDLMMGGDGTNVDDTELNDLHLSAICEAMNQMMGSAATSMSSMINEMVDISPPTATRVDFGEGLDKASLGDLSGQLFAQVSFRMEIGDLVDSEIMQLYPIEFARLIYQQFVGKTGGDSLKTLLQAKQLLQNRHRSHRHNRQHRHHSRRHHHKILQIHNNNLWQEYSSQCMLFRHRILIYSRHSSKILLRHLSLTELHRKILI